MPFIKNEIPHTQHITQMLTNSELLILSHSFDCSRIFFLEIYYLTFRLPPNTQIFESRSFVIKSQFYAPTPIIRTAVFFFIRLFMQHNPAATFSQSFGHARDALFESPNPCGWEGWYCRLICPFQILVKRREFIQALWRFENNNILANSFNTVTVK